MTVTLTTSSVCRGCGWTAEGRAADGQAEKHSKEAGHVTATTSTPKESA